MGSVTVTLDIQPSANDLGQLLEGVRAFNRSFSDNERPRPVACFLRDQEGRIVGGAQGDLWGRSIHIAAMWVAQAHRGHGHGSALLRAIEDYAVSQGYRLSFLETTSFQARPFYEKLGYQLFGELDGIDDGCTLYFLRKNLIGPAAADS
jgi:GNAT superfamily N-acetyltransferase